MRVFCCCAQISTADCTPDANGQVKVNHAVYMQCVHIQYISHRHMRIKYVMEGKKVI